MPHNRYFLPLPLNLNTEVIIEGTEFHHLSRVMRNKANDKVEIINGNGTLATGIIRSIEKKEAIIEIEESRQEPKPSFYISLILQIMRPSALEFAIEKATELGVSNIVIYPGAFSEKKQLSPTQITRLEGILVSACKQCGRLYLPSLSLQKNIKETIQQNLTNTFFGDPKAKFPPTTPDKLSNSATMYIGCEQGFSKDEESLLRSSGVEGIRFHENILRAETAAITAISYLYFLFRHF